MSDERETAEESRNVGDGTASESDEPLGDLADEVRERTSDSGRRDDAPGREGPLADVAAEVDERRREREDAADAFESVDVGDLDGERLWEELAEGETDEGAATVPPEDEVTVPSEDEVSVPPEDEVSVPPEDGGTVASGETAEAEWGEGRDVRTIPKETCHGCPHVADPPELACTHEGTDILAMPDTDHFRVADCPMVVEDDVGIGLGPEDSNGVGSSETDGDGPAGIADSDAPAGPAE